MVKQYDALSWFPQDPRELLTSDRLRFLTNEQLGAFMRLRCHLWLEGSAPVDDDKLARITESHERWPEIKDQVLSLLSKKRGKYVDKMLAETRTRQTEKHQARVNSGRAGGQKTAKRLKDKNIQSSNATSNATSGTTSGAQALEKSREDKTRVVTSIYRAEVRALSPALSTRPPENARECVAGFASEYERTHERAYSPESNDVEVMQGLLDKGASPADVQTRICWFFPWWTSYHRSRDGHQLPNVQEFVWAFNKIPPSGASGKAVSQYEDVTRCGVEITTGGTK